MTNRLQDDTPSSGSWRLIRLSSSCNRDAQALVETVRDALAEKNVTVTVSHRRSTLVDMTQRGLGAVVRASPHYFVTFAQLGEMIHALPAL